MVQHGTLPSSLWGPDEDATPGDITSHRGWTSYAACLEVLPWLVQTASARFVEGLVPPHYRLALRIKQWRTTQRLGEEPLSVNSAEKRLLQLYYKKLQIWALPIHSTRKVLEILE